MTCLAHHWEQEDIKNGILQGIKIGKEEGGGEGVEIGIVKTAINTKITQEMFLLDYNRNYPYSESIEVIDYVTVDHELAREINNRHTIIAIEE